MLPKNFAQLFFLTKRTLKLVIRHKNPKEPAPAAEHIYSTILVVCRSILSKGSTLIRSMERHDPFHGGTSVRGSGPSSVAIAHSSHTGNWSEVRAVAFPWTLDRALLARRIAMAHGEARDGRRVLESFGSRDTRSFLIVSLLLTLMRVRCTYGANLC